MPYPRGLWTRSILVDHSLGSSWDRLDKGKRKALAAWWIWGLRNRQRAEVRGALAEADAPAGQAHAQAHREHRRMAALEPRFSSLTLSVLPTEVLGSSAPPALTPRGLVMNTVG